ncbi:MAG: permease [Methanocorpusculum sp.]|nr:permease [Methanocorpusculum sp.]MDE2523212.1 permease [Methanocorpusculum sp.]MDE2523946.1 permease [Methanocorpusculum sp.]
MDFVAAIASGLFHLGSYAAANALTSLVPIFLLAGAIVVFPRSSGIFHYFTDAVPRRVSYPVALLSGAFLCVFSLVIIPMFAALHRRGSAVGPQIVFLYAGSALNVVAVAGLASVFGAGTAIVFVVCAGGVAVLAAWIMSFLFQAHTTPLTFLRQSTPGPAEETVWCVPVLFLLLILMLFAGTLPVPFAGKIAAVLLAGMVVVLYARRFLSSGGIREWMHSAGHIAVRAVPFLLLGHFLLGVFTSLIPPEMLVPYLSDNGFLSCVAGSLSGIILHVPAALDVPVLESTFGYRAGDIAAGPMVSLLLSGSGICLPLLMVVHIVIGTRRTVVYGAVILVLAALFGFLYGLAG